MAELPLDATEVVDLVEDQLSWLASASEGLHELRNARRGAAQYYGDDFRRAQPFVKMLSQTAVLSADGLDAAVSAPATRLAKWSAMLPKLGERMRFATIRQRNPAEEVAAWVTDGYELRAHDYVYADGQSFDFVTLRGVEYTLESVAIRSKKDSDRLLRGLPVHGCLVVTFQTVTCMHDGRVSLGIHDQAMSPGGFLVAPDTGLSLDFIAKNKWDTPVHPDSVAFGSAIGHQYVRRGVWEVELSLSKDRTGIALATDAVGARALVRALEASTVTRTGRRQALLHWVREHYRRGRTGGESSFVRAHLRGSRQYDAGGIFATIYPSRDDIERACNGHMFDTESGA